VISIVVNSEARIHNVKITSDMITQRSNFEIIADRQGVHWPDVDEDINIDGMLHGAPGRRA
jgi:uncharacterized protein DUF2442